MERDSLLRLRVPEFVAHSVNLSLLIWKAAAIEYGASKQPEYLKSVLHPTPLSVLSFGSSANTGLSIIHLNTNPVVFEHQNKYESYAFI